MLIVTDHFRKKEQFVKEFYTYIITLRGRNGPVCSAEEEAGVFAEYLEAVFWGAEGQPQYGPLRNVDLSLPVRASGTGRSVSSR
ncbi:hypothetical protein QE152_g24523 [Popillia japonica]|uniref:Uncharacterized protein n=1 Tax=Popillia japonica TaxID=7064 RepID=A0AAW1KFH9_POPJA